jgi:hypothetical protein
MPDDTATNRRVSWVVALNVVDDDGVEYEWMIDTAGANTATDAIDRALRMCDEEIVGLESVRKESA